MAEVFMGQELEVLQCSVRSIISYNEENGFAVLSCVREDTRDRIKVVGSMCDVHEFFVYRFKGSWVTHPVYGSQFSFVSYEELLPTSIEGIRRFLSSGLVKGIGEAYAERIVSKFGLASMHVIEEEPERLLDIQGIGEARLAKITSSWQAHKDIRNIYVFFEGYGITPGKVARIYKVYGQDSIDKVKENPYRLVDDIWGFGFKTADSIALKLGLGYENYDRIRSGLLYCLQERSNNGDCFVPWDALLQDSQKVLEVDLSLASSSLERMVSAGDVQVEVLACKAGRLASGSRLVFLKQYYYAELAVSNSLHSVMRSRPSVSVDWSVVRPAVLSVGSTSYDETQLEAIRMSVSGKVFILTGGPGTGKTTTVNGILCAFSAVKARILLAAPTGRAAKRLSEATGMDAVTIHRLLGVKKGLGSFTYNASNKLSGDVLVVDEMSMVDILLMKSLMEAVPDSMTVIFVGDVDQLPSVGAGNVLRDLIDSGCFPVVRLSRVFRQGEGSGIVNGAHAVNSGKLPDFGGARFSRDFYFINMESLMRKKGIFEYVPSEYSEAAAEEIASLVSVRLPHAFGVAPGDIQVLSPMHRDHVGVDELNQRLQACLNPGKDGVTVGRFVFRVDDRVMQLRNNYQKGVYNGDIGVVRCIDREENVVKVDFGLEEDVSYEFSELGELVLAYATTIHKSQGSEYPVVIVPVMMNHYIMLQRNLLYTAITRAKKLLVIVGVPRALSRAVRNMKIQERFTLLKERLCDWKPKAGKRKTG